jgi:hypothetical protein
MVRKEDRPDKVFSDNWGGRRTNQLGAPLKAPDQRPQKRISCFVEASLVERIEQLPYNPTHKALVHYLLRRFLKNPKAQNLPPLDQWGYPTCIIPTTNKKKEAREE